MNQEFSSKRWMFCCPELENRRCGFKTCLHKWQITRIDIQSQSERDNTCFFFFRDSSNLEILSVQAFSCSDIILLSLFPNTSPSQHYGKYISLYSINSKGSYVAYSVARIEWIAFPSLLQSLKWYLSNNTNKTHSLNSVAIYDILIQLASKKQDRDLLDAI